MRLHNNGCNCKRSGCLKNYCECYEAKIPCSANCKCLGCRNFEFRPGTDGNPGGDILSETTVTTGQKRSYEKISTSKKGDKSKEKVKGLCSEFLGSASNGSSTSGDGGGGGATTSGNRQHQPTAKERKCNLMTQEVIDATIQCMISQASECDKNGLSAYQTEKMIIEECGRCLVEIIDFSIRNTDNSSTQDKTVAAAGGWGGLRLE